MDRCGLAGATGDALHAATGGEKPKPQYSAARRFIAVRQDVFYAKFCAPCNLSRKPKA
jgi:hypothetical protein